MQISYLADHPEFIAMLAPAIFEYWRLILRDETLESRTSKLQEHLNRDVLPAAWVAHEHGEVLGTDAYLMQGKGVEAVAHDQFGKG